MMLVRHWSLTSRLFDTSRRLQLLLHHQPPPFPWLLAVVIMRVVTWMPPKALQAQTGLIISDHILMQMMMTLTASHQRNGPTKRRIWCLLPELYDVRQQERC